MDIHFDHDTDNDTLIQALPRVQYLSCHCGRLFEFVRFIVIITIVIVVVIFFYVFCAQGTRK